MSTNAFSSAHILLMLISAGLIIYLISLWQISKRKYSPVQWIKARTPIVRFASIYSLYFASVCLLAGLGFFRVVTMPPRFLLIFLPMVLSVVLLATAKVKGSVSILSSIPPAALIAVQSFRTVIELLLVQFLNAKLVPVEMSLHGRNFDVLIGILALPTAYLFWKKYRFARVFGIAFNILGLLSLLNIFSIVAFALPSTIQKYDTLYLPTYFPGVMIVFVATLAIYLHILSLKQLTVAKKIQLRTGLNADKAKLVVQNTKLCVLPNEEPVPEN